MQKITPCLWFNGNAEEAVDFYLSVFRNSRIVDTLRYGDAGPGPKGDVLLLRFELEGQGFSALNGGPQFTFTPAISLYFDCEDQQEVDRLWDALLQGGAPMQCGWLTDKFGVSWQIAPRGIIEMLEDPDPAKANSVMKAMMDMVKLDIAALRAAYRAA
jgi:predicted 3-demethylubiquinone-9 3-methyltransferase (glyoxalase superfamily)